MVATPLQALLRTNEVPLDGQIPMIRNFIVTAQDRLATLQNERDDLRSKAATLCMKIEALNVELSALGMEEFEMKTKAATLDGIIDAFTEQIRGHQAVLSVVRRVPADVLLEIFSWITLETFARMVLTESKVPTAPWRLTHVCRAWRAVALSYPKLWARVCIDGSIIDWSESDPKAPAISMLYPREALKTQLQLSSTASLDVELHMLEQSEEMRLLLEPLIQQSSRWARLILTSDAWSTLEYLKEIETKLPRLNYLVIDTGYDLLIPSWPTELRQLFFFAGHLRTAKLTNFALTSPSPPLSLPWHQLTKLRICSPLISLLNILSTAHHLVDCTLEVDDSEGNQTWATPPFVVTLPTVQRLTMGPSCSDDCSSWLVLPQLRFLALEGTPVEHARTLITQSQCRLETLELRHIEIKSDVLLAILQVVPSITNLAVDFCFTFTDEQIQSFLRSMTGSTLCPNLASMKIGFLSHQHTIQNSETACEMIESRWNPPTGPRVLQSVRLLPADNWPRFVWLRLEAMRLAGLDLNRLTVSNTR
ncbi:hypothetical protein R3P38DRAFT_1449284 [Favolaschia claudopus]|uniref:F-box domain-containing protein n=1 Tax=Favolaschia claudopus TaxID=2862362 RepID=A0AAW0AM91_9AGAR